MTGDTEQAEAMAGLYTGQPAGPAANEIQEAGSRVVRVRASSWGALFDCAHRVAYLAKRRMP